MFVVLCVCVCVLGGVGCFGFGFSLVHFPSNLTCFRSSWLTAVCKAQDGVVYL